MGKKQNIIVVTGTDTDIGKTWAGAALSLALRRAGVNVVAIKPLETGCEESPQESEDGVKLARAAGQTNPAAALLRFRDPVAASEAADREGRPIDYENLVQQIRQHANDADVALVEGAGGVLAPLTWDTNAIDLARSLGARILLVSSDRLGTINHTLLSLKALTASELETVAVVLTPPETPDSSTGTNAKAITRLSGYTRVHCVPRTSDSDLMGESMRTVANWLLQ